MQITTPAADALQQYLDLASDQMKLTAENMANVDTPGYKMMAVAINLGEESTVT